MNFSEDFKKNIFHINENTFKDSSLAVFDYQFHENQIYHSYCKALHKNPSNVKDLHDIPFLPIEFFKNHAIKSGNWKEQKMFKSSGTTSADRSKLLVKDLNFYHRLAKRIFENHFDKLSDYELIALLPSYLEQGDSSLISMVDYFMQFSLEGSHYAIGKKINNQLSSDRKKVLFGVSYALLDSQTQVNKSDNLIIIETGGMKGRKRELTRAELHQTLNETLKPKEIWSEYGMTELTSQAYGLDGKFTFPSWASVLIREVNDPFSYLDDLKTGGINIIDLANVDTCSFIETKDLGKKNKGSFEVLGRFDNSELRGCNLMV